MRVLDLARFTFLEAVRRRFILAAVGLTAVFLVLYAVGTHFAVRELEESPLLLPSFRPVILAQLLLTGVWLVSLSSGMLGIFASCGTLSSEIESHTLQSIAVKPLQRWEIVLGKWLGLTTMAAVYTLVAATAVIAIVWVRAGYVAPNPPAAVAALMLQAAVLVSLTVLVSAFLPNLAAGIGVFLLHALAMAGGIEEQLGVVLRNQTMQDIGVWISVLIPTDAMGKIAAAALQTSSGAADLAMAGPFAVVHPPSPWMALYAAIYLAACLAVAVARFERCDL
jgi:ABC-type transport system involved in multi-copper enzyme maturation permease subunit